VTTTTYTTVNGVILSQATDGVVHHFVPDPLGSVAMVRDAAGNTVYEAEYSPYGQVQSETGTNPSSLGFVGTLGYITDSVSSLYVRARYLLPALGRWLTKDPGYPEELSYVYANCDPINLVDTSGWSPFSQRKDTCYVLSCRYYFGIIPTHGYICGKHRGKVCSGGISSDAFTDDGAVCNPGFHESGVSGQFIYCAVISTDCDHAAGVCACIAESRKGGGKPDYLGYRLCFGYVERMENCGCVAGAKKKSRKEQRAALLDCELRRTTILVYA
jgi:RHS repeat-associated protein